MKKNMLRVCALTLILLVLAGMSGVCAFADTVTQYVYDPVYLLNDAEYAELNEKARSISEQYECAVHFVITDDPALTEENIRDYSKELYMESPVLGYGPEKDGFMLVLGTENRCYHLLAYGSFGNYALTDYGKDWMSENFVSYFANDDWYGGFNSYVNDCEYVLENAAAGTPVDIYYDDDLGPADTYPIAAAVGAVISLITCTIFKIKMKNTGIADTAQNYLDFKNVEITHRSDVFRYKDVNRRRRKDDDDDDSRGGTTVDRDGFSGKSGSF